MGRTPPLAALAQELDGELYEQSVIVDGTQVITCSPSGVVRHGATHLGKWNDPPEVLAAAFREAVAR